VLFAILVLRRVRIRIAAQPELLDELVPLFIVAQALERLQLLSVMIQRTSSSTHFL
jgi:hypothetical protein